MRGWNGELDGEAPAGLTIVNICRLISNINVVVVETVTGWRPG